RRLGLLDRLKGNDIGEKYPSVFVAQTRGIALSQSGRWSRVPIKTDQSTTFFVLHDFLREIGFVEWAIAQGDRFLFPELMRLAGRRGVACAGCVTASWTSNSTVSCDVAE